MFVSISLPYTSTPITVLHPPWGDVPHSWNSSELYKYVDSSCNKRELSPTGVIRSLSLNASHTEWASVIRYVLKTVCKAILLIYKSHTYSYWIIYIFFVWAVFHFETNLASEHNKVKGTCCAPVLFLEGNKGGTFVNYCGVFGHDCAF